MAEYSKVEADLNDVASLDTDTKAKACREVGYNKLVFKSSFAYGGYTEERAREFGGKLTVDAPLGLLKLVERLPVLLAAIKDEKFTFFYQTGSAAQKNMVLPFAWESIIKPGCIVDLQFDDLGRNHLENTFPPLHRRIRYAQMAALDPSSASYKLSVDRREVRRSISPEPNVSPSAGEGWSHQRGLSGFISNLAVLSD